MLNEKTKCADCHHCLVRMCSIFNVLDHEHVSLLEQSKSNVNLKQGETLFKEGQYPSGFYVITQGKIKISKMGFEGREQILRFAKQGDVVGYRSLLGDETFYNCTATAITMSHLCFMPRDFVFKLMADTPRLGFLMMKELADELKKLDDQITNFAQKTVRERVAEAILILKEIYGFEDDNETINVILKRDEIAAIAGTVRETVTRFLYDFNESGSILLEGKKIKILNLKALVKTANLID